ncbi:hypothetical protein JGE30_24505, partial [Salmonella enterica subsp. enterica serovar Give]|nr:hypothetical protein [Salmonella enterica subsp. enterica serovar Give]
VGIPNVVVHIDDVLIFSETREEHVKTLHMVFERLEREGVTLNHDRCVFAINEVNFLGHKISERGIDVLPSCVSVIINFPEPHIKKQSYNFRARSIT